MIRRGARLTSMNFITGSVHIMWRLTASWFAPEIRAAIALNRDQPAKSLELLESASPYERSYIEAIYFRGLAYLRLHKGAEAVAEFRKIVDHKGASWAATWVHPWWGRFYAPSWL